MYSTLQFQLLLVGGWLRISEIDFQFWFTVLRLDKLRTKHCRDSTIEAKAKVDSLGLQLQNLRYEVLHLQKEVNKCTNYKVNN